MLSERRKPELARCCIARRCRLIAAAVGLFLLSLTWPIQAGETAEAIVLRAGESKVLGIPEVTRVAVGQPSVADVRVLSVGEVLINGKAEGQTTLLLWPPSGKPLERVVRVLCAPPVLSGRDVSELVGDDQVRVREVAGYLVVEGSPTPEARTRLTRLAGLVGSRLLDLTAPADDLRMERTGSSPGQDGSGVSPERLETAQAILSKVARGPICLTTEGGLVMVGGSVPTEEARQKTAELARTFFPGRTVELLEVHEVRSLFAIKARLLELDRQAARDLGLEWPAAVTAGETTAPGKIALQPLARLEALLLKVKLLEESGKARTLAEPSMTVLDGEEGALLAGGQIPVPLEVEGRTTVEWKEYGVRLRVRPVRLSSGLIRLVARPEVSTLDWANGVRLGSGTVPALRSRWTETAVEQRSGDTLILAGLSLTEETEHRGVVPGVSDIPLLGALFQGGRSGRRTTELAILLTTTELPPAAGKVGADLDTGLQDENPGGIAHGR